MFPLRALAALGRDAKLPRQTLRWGTTGLKWQERQKQMVQAFSYFEAKAGGAQRQGFLQLLSENLFVDTEQKERLRLRLSGRAVI